MDGADGQDGGLGGLDLSGHDGLQGEDDLGRDGDGVDGEVGVARVAGPSAHRDGEGVRSGHLRPVGEAESGRRVEGCLLYTSRCV